MGSMRFSNSSTGADPRPKMPENARQMAFYVFFPMKFERNADHFQSPRSSATLACKPSGVTVAGGQAGSITSAILENTPRG